jgi:sortase A
MSRLAVAVRLTGELMITLGVIILLFVGYELKYTNVYTAREQSTLRSGLQQSWQAAPAAPAGQSPVLGAAPASPPVSPPVDLGEGIAILRVPRLGSDWAKVVVEGVGVEDLKKGPGHYPGTAMPGEVGNFVVSGHRTTYGAPFNRLDEVATGDAVVVETRDHWFTYRVTGEQVVAPTAIEVTYAVPGNAQAVPAQAVLTFTTCNPKYSASQRLVVHGLLESTQAKSAGVPPALRS